MTRSKVQLFVTSISMLALLAAGTLAEAQTVSIGQPTFGGNGCPNGSTAVSMVATGQDTKQISILFDRFTADAGVSTGKQLDRKDCSVGIPVRVPQGYSVAIFAIDYRGFMSVPVGGGGNLAVNYYYAGSQGVSFRKDFPGGFTDDYLFSNRLQAETAVWSQCGGDVILRTDAAITVKSNPRNDQATGSVDSIDVSSGIIYSVQFRRCEVPVPTDPAEVAKGWVFTPPLVGFWVDPWGPNRAYHPEAAWISADAPALADQFCNNRVAGSRADIAASRVAVGNVFICNVGLEGQQVPGGGQAYCTNGLTGSQYNGRFFDKIKCVK